MSRPKGIKETKLRDTLRRKRLIKAIPTSETLREAGTKAGYSPRTQRVYSKSTKRYIIQELRKLGTTPEECQKMFSMIRELALNKGDLTNSLRSTESISRISGAFKDAGSVNITLNQPTVLEKYLNNRIDTSPINTTEPKTGPLVPVKANE